jgi:2-methylcitrate dehydratase PrpD
LKRRDTMGATGDIAEWVCGTDYSAFNSTVVKYSKDLCINALGGSLAGSTRRAGQTVIRYVKECRAHPEAGIIGGGFRTSIEYAAFANGSTYHATELEDDAEPESTYTCGVLPAAFALGEAFHLSGKEIIQGFVLGYEVAVKLSGKCGEMLTRGWLTDCVFGTVGVAALTAKMLRLSVHETIMAMSVAASQSSGLLRQTGTGAHLYEAGLCGRNGISAAMLAKHGLTGQPDILECPNGLCYAGAGVSDLGDLQLGKYRITGVTMKKYPACSIQHHIINGVLELKKEHAISAESVDGVQIDVHPGILRACRYQHPANEEQTPFSVPHSVAVCFLAKKFNIDVYTDATAQDSNYYAFREKVKLVVHPEWDMPGISGREYFITIRLRDGKEYKKVTPSSGETIVLTDDEIKERYMDGALRVLSQSKAEETYKMIRGLDELRDVSRLMTMLTSTKGT